MVVSESETDCLTRLRLSVAQPYRHIKASEAKRTVGKSSNLELELAIHAVLNQAGSLNIEMPYQGHHHISQQDHTVSQSGDARGLDQDTQALGLGERVGSSQRGSRPSSISAAGDTYFFPSRDVQRMSTGSQTAQAVGMGSPSAPVSAIPNPSQAFETPRRTQTSARQPEELHIPPSYNAMSQQSPGDLSRHHSHNLSQEVASGTAPGIHVQKATPQGSHYSNASTGMSLPGALQSGRPGPLSSTTAPSSIPTLPQASTHAQQYPNSSRSSLANHLHTYSRSSPTGIEQQKYVPYANTPENSKFASPPNQRYTSSHTPQAGASYSPLGLADIRPLGEPGLPDGPMSANPYSNDGINSVPTNSNYLAPWAVYAFDWCKWPVQQQSLGDAAGKMAIGSYVEDGHNFVSRNCC